MITRSCVLITLPSSRTCWVKSMLDGRRRCSICSMAFSTCACVMGIVSDGVLSGGTGAKEGVLSEGVCVNGQCGGGVQMTAADDNKAGFTWLQ